MLRITFQPITAEHWFVTSIYTENEMSLYYLRQQRVAHKVFLSALQWSAVNQLLSILKLFV